MEQLLGVFLLVSLVMMVIICAPSILGSGTKRRKGSNSSASLNAHRRGITNTTFSYFDKFSESLRVLRDLKDVEMVADDARARSSRQKHGQKTFVANASNSNIAQNHHLHRFQPKVPAYKRTQNATPATMQRTMTRLAPERKVERKESKKSIGYSVKSRLKASQLGYLRNAKVPQTRNQSVMGVSSLNNYQRDMLIKNISDNERYFIQASKLGEFAKFEFNSALNDAQSFDPTGRAYDIRRKTKISSALAETSALIDSYSDFNDDRRRA